MDFRPAAAVAARANFDGFKTAYKTVGEHAVTVDVLVPKGLKSGVRPLLVRFHGGGLVMGSGSFLGFFAPWVMEYAMLHSAILVCPNHRLLPESSGLDILDDLADFWGWVGDGLQAFVAKSVGLDLQVDLTRMIAMGESAGGYLAIQSALLPCAPPIRAITAAYPMLDLHAPYILTPTLRPMGLPLVPNTLIETHCSAMIPGEIVTEADPPARLELFRAMLQHARFIEFLGEDPRLFPLERIEDMGKAEGEGNDWTLPPLFCFHGQDDSIVPAVGSERFVEIVRRLGRGEVVLTVKSGEHGFDKGGLEMEWLGEGLDFVTKAWLG